MKLEPGMRVRCVDSSGYLPVLEQGTNYTIDRVDDLWPGERVRLKELHSYAFFATRFKPVVRVKAVCIPSFEVLVARACAAFSMLPEDQQAAHWAAQRASWVRGNVGWD